MSEYGIFSVIGIEIEYMLVQKDNLAIAPIADQILTALCGEPKNEIALGPISISNELVLHVIELKNNGPKPITHSHVTDFQNTIKKLQPILEQYNVCLLPTGAHPWMQPDLETKRWPHGSKAIYQQYDRIFNCCGHGWANLQSMHVNLPFANDEEFCQLHNAIRIILPLLPALCASTPILERRPTGILDSRLALYAKNQAQIASISGDIIPEFISSEDEYRQRILNPMFADIKAYDPEGILQYEWLNSRGAIPKFDYGAIEIRILDTQECVTADIAIAKLIFALLKYLVENSPYLENVANTKVLKQLYDQTIKDGLSVKINNKELLAQWTIEKQHLTVREVWEELITKVANSLDAATQDALENILTHGNLSERILKQYQPNNLLSIYQNLAECLLDNKLFKW